MAFPVEVSTSEFMMLSKLKFYNMFGHKVRPFICYLF